MVHINNAKLFLKKPKKKVEAASEATSDCLKYRLVIFKYKAWKHRENCIFGTKVYVSFDFWYQTIEVLCASNQGHTVVEPLIAPEGAKPGGFVAFSGHDGKPEDVLNPKKKQLDKITPHLFTDDKGIATFKGIPFMTSSGPCTSSIVNGSIK